MNPRCKLPMLLAALGVIAGLIGCGSQKAPQATPSPTPAGVDDHRIRANQASGKEWLSYNFDYDETRYSPLRQIDTGNVGRLGLAWSYDLGSERGVEATPIVADGVMYVTGPWSVVHAIDARTGARLWVYDPKVPPEFGAWACCDVVNRGVAVYKGKVFVGTLHGYLVALEAASGKELWRVDTNIDRTRYKHTITGAPRVFRDKVVIGHGGAELAAVGYVSAYHVDDGRMLWRWFSVPQRVEPPFYDPSQERAAATWDPKGAWREVGGGGTIWDAMVYDHELNRLYVGTGNGNPWNREVRSPSGGDNLYLSSVVALDADTGRYLWHFQEVPGDTWDYTATQHLILAELKLASGKRKVLLHAPKNGFFYVIDRQDGKLISAKPYVEVNWATGYDESGRPIEVEDARARQKPWETRPSAYGAHNWHPMSFNPNTGLVYIPAQGVPLAIEHDPQWRARTHLPGRPMSNLDWNLGYVLNTIPPQAKPFGHLLAWDPVAQKEVWRQEYLSPWNGGTMTTAGGLVFQGTADGRFIAYDAKTGASLWQVEVGSGVIAGPATYEIDGTQYVTVAVGWGGVYGLAARATERLSQGRVYTFKLDGKAPLPPVREYAQLRRTTLASGLPYRAEDVGPGAQLYVSNCLFCHGVPALDRGGNLPNLAYSDPQILSELPKLVRGGAWRARGMPDFAERLSDADVERIAAFILNMADIVAQTQAENAADQEP
ncbi:PQQ-dependent dehydrogenase, methanol/ethanol family [Sinimarinibacterium thermocellulolyticum]|uniref:PQQ-dependent dehydrogenase, methanol/ethanol family n=1 Tax=Sinimarinibacterium thermocellulolyticum TaxID=3170016 RepID=A0ABV2ACR0_9GAMM